MNFKKLTEREKEWEIWRKRKVLETPATARLFRSWCEIDTEHFSVGGKKKFKTRRKTRQRRKQKTVHIHKQVDWITLISSLTSFLIFNSSGDVFADILCTTDQELLEKSSVLSLWSFCLDFFYHLHIYGWISIRWVV